MLGAYGPQAVLPAYSADDIIQIQTISNDTINSSITGAGGYYLGFKVLPPG
jgi:hypothetical protein